MSRHRFSDPSRSALLLALMISAGPALAQADDAAAGDGAIVVTARHSTERLQDVPLSITAQSGEKLQELGISDLEGIARITPGLQFKDFVTTFHGNATIRGLGQANTSNPVGNVGVFVNGVYLQRGYMVDTSLGDFSRVEVVKGPQSALYGQNTFAGAINYVTNEPTNEFHANGEATFGDYGRKEVQLGVGGPIIDGILAARVYVAKSLYGGSWKNNATGDLGDLKHFGGYNRDAFSGALKFTPSSRLTINLFYQRDHREEELRPYYTLDGTYTGDKLNCGPTNASTGRPSLFCGKFPVNPSAYRTGSQTAAPYSVDQPKTVTTTQIAKASIDYEISDALQAHYVYGWTKGTAQEDQGAFSNTVDPTGRATISPQHEGGVLNYSSHELRLAYDDHGPVTLETGYFHSNARDRYLFGNRAVTAGQPITRISTDPLYIPAGFLTLTNYDAHYEVNSVFGRGAVKLFNDKLTLGAEARYSWTDIRYMDLQTPTLPELQAKYHNLSPRFTADYKLTQDNMLYASAAKGVKSGGFNGRKAGTVVLTTSEQSYGEEENWTYEVGSKNSFFDHKLLLNVALFYVDWNKKQNSVQPSGYVNTGVFTPGTVPPNSYQTTGAATSKGIEVEGSVRPLEGLTISYSGALMDPKYKKNVIAGNFIGLCTGGNCPITANIGGNQIERTSKFAGTIGIDYIRPLKAGWNGFVGVDGSYQTKQYADAVNESWISDYALANARLGVSNDRWKAWVFVNNLFDKKYIESVFVIQNTRLNQAAYGERRTIGATIAFHY